MISPAVFPPGGGWQHAGCRSCIAPASRCGDGVPEVGRAVLRPILGQREEQASRVTAVAMLLCDAVVDLGAVHAQGAVIVKE